MTAKIIKITPIEEIFSISWMIGTRCNFDCMYCPATYHDDTSDQLSLENLQAYWLSVYNTTKHKNLKYKISFTGGEVTVNKNFLPFIIWLRDNYNSQIDKLMVTTNGSASTDYYKKMFKYIDNISFSFHSEHVDEVDFFNKMRELKETINSNSYMMVNIMNEIWNTDRIPLYEDFLTKHNVDYSINQIDYSHQTRTYPILKGRQNLDV